MSPAIAKRSLDRSPASVAPGHGAPRRSHALTCLAALAVIVLLLAGCATTPTDPAPVIDNSNAAAEAALDALDQAETALAEGDVQRAELLLDAAADDLPRSARGRYQRARSQMDSLRTDPGAAALAAVAEEVERTGRIDASGAVTVLQRLETVPGYRLAEEARKPTRLGQWAAFAVDVRETLLGREDLLEAATEWAALHPLHPVNEQVYMEAAWQYGQRFQPPGRIAVLLPNSGPLAAAGAAIRDGLVSAWLDDPARSELTFLGVGAEPTSALEAYRRAEANGYQWVIGPLSREAVQLVVDQPGASLPGLLLNWPERASSATAPASPIAPESPPVPAQEADFYGLSLSQEAEAAAVAVRMLDEGHRRAILLLANNDWGQRAESAFVDAYLAGGGEIVSLERFDARDADHSAKLMRLLQIEDGRERKRRLQSTLDLPLEFEDSRRDDFGAFFLAADPTLGRQLKPQLRFFDAGEKPVFAMSRVFTGRVDPGRDVDLDGVVIPATRSALAPAAETPEFASLRGGAFGSLYDLGRDAWHLLPWLDLMARDPAFSFPGAIGDLRLGGGGRLLREPAWAEFRSGRPVALGDGP